MTVLSQTTRISKLEEALREIHGQLVDHPMFNGELYETDDLAALDDIGGDETFITYLARIARDVLEGNQ